MSSDIQFGDSRLPERFWSKVFNCPVTGCWLWTATANSNGYGHFRIHPRTVTTHRLLYTILVEPVPSSLAIDHLCRVRRCCNPTHLEPVTQQVNLLRGTGMSAVHAVKTHCPKGHEYSVENTYRGTSNQRFCRTCMKAHKSSPRYKAQQRAYHAARKAG